MSNILPAVQDAIEEIKQAFPGHELEVVPDGNGGARLTVHGIELSEKYQSGHYFIGFLVAHTYPASDIYPHFIGPRVAWKNVGAMDGLSESTWHDKPATQISRRSNRWNRDVDTAALKLQKVIEWLKAK